MTHSRYALLCMATALTLCATRAQAQQQGTPVTLRITPADATVKLDGVPVDASRPLNVPAGTHVLRIEAPGHVPREETLDVVVEPGREIIMSVNLSREPLAPTPSMRSEGIVEQMDYGRPITGWIMTGAGAALIATSIVLAVRSSSPPACANMSGDCPDAQNLSGWTTLTGVLGGASLVGGLTLLSWRSLAGEPAPMGADSASLSLSGTGLLLRVEY